MNVVLALGMRHVFRQINIFLLLIIMLLVFVQQAKAQEPKEFIVSAGYGAVSLFVTPDFTSEILLSEDTINGDYSSRTNILETDLKIKPISVKGEIRLNERTSIGIQVFYNGFVASGIRIDSSWVASSNTYEVETSSIRYVMNRLRIQFGYTRHFYLNHPNWDMYTCMAIGSNSKFRKYYVNNELSEMENTGLIDFLPVFPVSMRFTYGVRYFFSERFGIQSELSIGGPLLNIGFAAKL